MFDFTPNYSRCLCFPYIYYIFYILERHAHILLKKSISTKMIMQAATQAIPVMTRDFKRYHFLHHLALSKSSIQWIERYIHYHIYLSIFHENFSSMSEAIIKASQILLILVCAKFQPSRGYIYVLCWSET